MELRNGFTLALLVAVLCLVLPSMAMGQTADVPDPAYSAGAFLGFNHYDQPQMKGGAFFDVRIADKTYNESTLNMTSQVATVTTSIKRYFYTTPAGTVKLFGNVAVGVATGDGVTSGVFAGGGGVKLMLAGVASKFPALKLFGSVPGAFTTGAVNVQQINGLGVSPTFTFAIGVDFK